MRPMKGDYDEIVEKMLMDISEGKRIDFVLVEHCDPNELNDSELEYYITYAIDWFMVRHGLNREKATNIIMMNLRYIVGYYDFEYASAWREAANRIIKKHEGIEVVK